MRTIDKFSLKGHNSFGVQAFASKLVRLDRPEDIAALKGQSFVAGKDLVLGGGSNILFAEDVPGTVFLNRIKGRTIAEENDDFALVDVSSGENWHDFVLWSINQGLHGLENLSLIPGLAGAAPMQNIGAYGVEFGEHLQSVTAYDWHIGETLDIPLGECGLGYRDSRFKSAEPDRFLIISSRLKLNKRFEPRLGYAGLAEELSSAGITVPDARQVCDAVIRIRQRKLPDPEKIGNAGSFFKNPVIKPDEAEQLKLKFPELPVYPINSEASKTSAAWMIEHCGWKGFRDGDAGVSGRHALVLVNHGDASGSELFELSKKITQSVFETFGIKLETEPKIFAQSF